MGCGSSISKQQNKYIETVNEHGQKAFTIYFSKKINQKTKLKEVNLLKDFQENPEQKCIYISKHPNDEHQIIINKCHLETASLLLLQIIDEKGYDYTQKDIIDQESHGKHNYIIQIYISEKKYLLIGMGQGFTSTVQDFIDRDKKSKEQNLKFDNIDTFYEELLILLRKYYQYYYKFDRTVQKELSIESSIALNKESFLKRSGTLGYSAIFQISNLIDFLKEGFKYKYEDSFKKDLEDFIIITLYGGQNRGKTFLLKYIFDIDNIQDGQDIRTEGLSIIQKEFGKINLALVDMEGTKSAFDRSNKNINNLFDKQVENGKQNYFYQQFQEKIINNFIITESNVLMFVLNSISDVEQMTMRNLIDGFSNHKILINPINIQVSQKEKKINTDLLIIIHNLYHIKHFEQLKKEIKKICLNFDVKDIDQKKQKFNIYEENIDLNYYTQLIFQDENDESGGVPVHHVFFANQQSPEIQSWNKKSSDFIKSMITNNQFLRNQTSSSNQQNTEKKTIQNVIKKSVEKFFKSHAKFSEGEGEKKLNQITLEDKENSFKICNPQNKIIDFKIDYSLLNHENFNLPQSKKISEHTIRYKNIKNNEVLFIIEFDAPGYEKEDIQNNLEVRYVQQVIIIQQKKDKVDTFKSVYKPNPNQQPQENGNETNTALQHQKGKANQLNEIGNKIDPSKFIQYDEFFLRVNAPDIKKFTQEQDMIYDSHSIQNSLKNNSKIFEVKNGVVKASVKLFWMPRKLTSSKKQK